MSKPEKHAQGSTEVAVVVLLGNSLPDASRCDVSVVMQRRVDAPHGGRLALPSVIRRLDEDLDQAARRAAMSVGVSDPAVLEQVRTDADPGSADLLVSYLATAHEAPFGLQDDPDVELLSVAMLHERSTQGGILPVASHPAHHRALAASLAAFAGLIERTPISLSLVPTVFTLGQLRSVYESAWDKRLDLRNFRRKLIDAPQPFLSAVGETLSSRGTEGRPPELYRATDAWTHSVPIRFPRGSQR